MKKRIISFLISIILLMFLGCSIEEPAMCNVTVTTNTSYLNKSDVFCKAYAKVQSVPLGTYVTVITECDESIYPESVTTNVHSSYIKDKENENIFYVLVNDTNFEISVRFEQRRKISVYKKTTNCTIDVKEKVYQNLKVEFEIIPDEYYILDAESVKISDGDYSDLIQDPVNPYKFSFIPEDWTSVRIDADCVPSINIKPQKEKYNVGETVTFDLSNKSSLLNCDIYYSYSHDKYKELLTSNVDLSKGTYSFTATEAGNIIFFAKLPGDDNYFEIGNVDVYSQAISKDLKPLSLHLVDQKDFGSYVKFYFSVNKQFSVSTSLNYEYYYEDKPDNVIKSFEYTSDCLFDLTVTKVYDVSKKLFLKVYSNSYWTGSETVQYCSDVIVLEQPLYPEEPVSCKTSTISYYKLNFPNYNSFKNAIVEIEEGASEYFSVVIDEENNTLNITAKKTTDIYRKIILKDDSGNIKSVIEVKIPYDGNPQYSIS